jgi:2-dehydro-3-deoxyphosphooctonate aldolase (KDO 8-P synthase)
VPGVLIEALAGEAPSQITQATARTPPSGFEDSVLSNEAATEVTVRMRSPDFEAREPIDAGDQPSRNASAEPDPAPDGARRMRIAGIPVGGGAALLLIAGLNVIENLRGALECAHDVQDIADSHGMPVVFKASFDKANRSRVEGYRGPGLEEGLRILSTVKRETGLPLLTDVHEPFQAKIASEVVDCLQIPAYLCRQTDLIAACAATGLPINLKKGQFLAPNDMRHAVAKVRAFGRSGVLVTDRGTSFGYNNLVVDMRGLQQMRAFAPVCLDATHSVQYPGTADGASGGDRRFVPALARAAVAAGVDAVFVEVHADPQAAPVDGPCQIDLTTFDTLLGEVRALDRALRALREERVPPGASGSGRQPG